MCTHCNCVRVYVMESRGWWAEMNQAMQSDKAMSETVGERKER